MLVTKFYIKDIKKFEEEEHKSVIDILSSLDLDGLADLIVLGNMGQIDKDQAFDLLDMFVQDHNLIEAFEDVKRTLFGPDPEDGEPGVDITDYKNLTEVYTKMCFELMSVGIQYGEFWQFSTTEMYDAFNACNIKMENDINAKLSMAYNEAALIASAVWGKLPKEAPKVSLVERGEKIIHTEEYGDLTESEFRDVCKAAALVAQTGGK